jgi:murein DD-endopeptidase MepM/ murein hydrolase activator NlpD
MIACGFTFGIAVGGAAYGIAPRNAEAAAIIAPTAIAAPAGLPLTAAPAAAPAAPANAPEPAATRIAGLVGEDLNASLRAAGVAEPVAADYLKALATRIDMVRGISVMDRFDLVIVRPPAAGQGPRLLYAGLDRVGASDLQLLRWTIERKADWVDASGSGTQVAGLAWPVPARVSSGFGMRLHPLLGFMRFHRGIDLRAGWGAPIVAAADGRVAAAGYSGGYGNQVRLVHAGGIATSYAHMSRIAAAPGQMVRQGQVIGYVGSTGLSSGPHLHYEVSRNGRPVNPVGIQVASSTAVDQRDRDAFRSTMRQVLLLKPAPATA